MTKQLHSKIPLEYPSTLGQRQHRLPQQSQHLLHAERLPQDRRPPQRLGQVPPGVLGIGGHGCHLPEWIDQVDGCPGVGNCTARANPQIVDSGIRPLKRDDAPVFVLEMERILPHSGQVPDAMAMKVCRTSCSRGVLCPSHVCAPCRCNGETHPSGLACAFDPNTGRCTRSNSSSLGGFCWTGLQTLIDFG